MELLELAIPGHGLLELAIPGHGLLELAMVSRKGC